MKRMAMLLLSLALLGGCAVFHEEHFVEVPTTSGGKNYLRIRVDGHGGLTRLRYLSGYYDERAVDLYFNEVKSTPNQPDVDIAPIFAANQMNPGTQDLIRPLDPAAGHGALVMIFSSNPNAIADTIGQFAENQQVADAVTNLVNRRDVKSQRTSAATVAARSSRYAASAVELQSLADTLPSDRTAVTTADRASINRVYLNMLRSVAITLGGDGKFDDFGDAATWIAAKRSEQ